MFLARLLASALLIVAAIAPQAHAQSSSVEIAKFCGLNDTDAGNTIADCAAKSSLNVETNLGGTALLKRAGYTKVATMSIATAAVSGAVYFRDTSGSEDIVVCNSRNCAVSKNGGAFTNFYTTASVATTRYGFVVYNGAVFGVDDQHDAAWKYEGTSFTNPSGMPACSILALTQDRMICANTTANPNRLNFSKSGDFSTWSTGVNNADPFTDDIGTPGDQITGLSYWQGILYVFKQYSVTGCIPDNQYNTSCQVLTSVIGTSEPNSIVQGPDGLYFRGTDQNFWRYDGAVFRNISLQIQNTIKTFASGSTGFSIQTTEADLEAGNQRPTGSWNTTTTAGSIFPSSFSFVNTSSADFKTGANGQTGTAPPNYLLAGAIPRALDIDYRASVLPENASQAWAKTVVGNGTASLLGGGWVQLAVTGGSPCPSGGNSITYTQALSLSATTHQLIVFTAGGTFSGLLNLGTIGFYSTSAGRFVAGVGKNAVQNGIDRITNQITTASTFTVVITSYSSASIWRNGTYTDNGTFSDTVDSIAFQVKNTPDIFTGNCAGSGVLNVKVFDFSSNVVDAVKELGTQNIPLTSTFTSAIFNTGFSTNVMGPFHDTATVNGGSLDFQLRASSSPNNDLWGNWVSTGDGLRIGTTNQYVQYRVLITPSVDLTSGSVITGVSLAGATTGVFVTQCIQPPSTISGYGLLTCDTTLGGNGSLTFFSTSAATCGALPTSSMTSSGFWTTSSNNAVLTIATNTAVAIRIDPTITSSTDTAQANACTVNWKLGTTPPPVWGVYNNVNNAIYWSGDVNSSTNTNRWFKYDLNTTSFWPFDVPAQAPLFYKNSLYFGSGLNGNWYQYAPSGINSDDGNAITSSWASKDFPLADPFQEKILRNLSLVATNQGSGSISVTGSADGGNSTLFSVSIGTSASTGYIRSNYELPVETVGSPYSFFGVRFANSTANNPWSILGFRLDFDLQPWRPLSQ